MVRAGCVWLALMVAPFAILFLIVTVIPVLASIVLSFFQYDMINPPQFIGLDNYFRMFISDQVFLIALQNTLKLAVITGPIGFLLSFVLAWMINDLSPASRTALSFLFYSPALMGSLFHLAGAFRGELTAMPTAC